MSDSSPPAAGTSPPMSPTAAASTSPQRSKSRTSWLSLSRRRRKNAKLASTPAPPAPPSAFEQHQHLLHPPDTLVPIQFAPNRIATLYVTPSDRDLYLAAMAQLDAPPQALPLWADPAPKLPGPPARIDPVIRGFSPAPHPLTSASLSPKLVTSPDLPESGLQIREEFRAPAVQAPSTRYALMSLVPNAFLRFTGFPPGTIAAIDQALTETWPLGVWWRSEAIDVMRAMSRDGEGFTWQVELHGRAWKRKGSQELDSVRLVLALFTTLGVHGWSVVDSVQAAGLQKATHNLLFRHSADIQARPPAFFAISLPLPDRISVISPPNKITPAMLTAVRDAITSNSHRAGHSRSGTAANDASSVAATANNIKRVTWGKEVRAKGIKEEGWVHPGGIRPARVESLQPQILLSLVSNLSALGFDLAASVPLLPVSKGRDILYFASTPASGLTYLDGYRQDATATPSSRCESPVLVSPSASLDPAATAPNGAAATPPVLLARKVPPGRTSVSRDKDGGERVLPWMSILSDDQPVVQRAPSRQDRARRASPSRQSVSPTAAAPPVAMPQEVVRRLRTASQDSTLPLVPATQSELHGKQRNVLVKKGSVRRRSISRSSSVSSPRSNLPSSMSPPADGVMRAEMATAGPEGEEWATVDLSASGLTVLPTHELSPAASGRPAPPTLPPPLTRLPSIPGPPIPGVLPSRPVGAAEHQSARPSFESNASVYQDTCENQPGPQSGPGRSHQDHNPQLGQIPLGQPLDQSQLEAQNPAGQLAPLRQPAVRRAGSAVVAVEGGIGVTSMHGSLGFSPGSMARSNVSDGMSEVSVAQPVPPPKMSPGP